MSYIAKAFVRISSLKIKDEVFTKLKNTDGISTALMKREFFKFIIFDRGFVFDCRDKYIGDHVEDKGFIDCNFYANGDEEKAIELFLELAKMEDSKVAAKNQWIFDKYEDGSYGNLHKSTAKYPCLPFKYAEPLELAEAFKQGKINLK